MVEPVLLRFRNNPKSPDRGAITLLITKVNASHDRATCQGQQEEKRYSETKDFLHQSLIPLMMFSAWAIVSAAKPVTNFSA